MHKIQQNVNSPIKSLQKYYHINKLNKLWKHKNYQIHQWSFIVEFSFSEDDTSIYDREAIVHAGLGKVVTVVVQQHLRQLLQTV